MASAVIIAAVPTVVGDRYRSRQRLGLIGLLTVAATLAAAAVPFLVTLLASTGWRQVYLLFAIGLPLAVLVGTVVGERRTMTAAGARRLPPVRWATLGPICVTTMLSSALYSVVLLQFPGRLRGLGADELLGSANTITGAASVIGAVAFGRLGRRGPALPLPVSFAATGMGLVRAGVGATVPLVLTGAALAALGCGVLLPAVLAWATVRLNLEQRGRSVEWWANSGGVGTVLVATFGPGLTGALGSVGPLMAVLGALGRARCVRRRAAGDGW